MAGMSGEMAYEDKNPNHELCDILTELANYERYVNGEMADYYKYRFAIVKLGNHPTPIESRYQATTLMEIEHKIADIIDEYIKTGKVHKLEKILSDPYKCSIIELTRIWGIGTEKAKALFEAGVMTINELHANLDKLTNHQIIGLRYFEEFDEKIPRTEIKDIVDIISNKVTEFDRNFLITAVGSYRRGKHENTHVNILLTHPEFKSSESPKKRTKLLQQVVGKLKDMDLVTDTVSLGTTQFLGVCKHPTKHSSIARRLHIRLTSNTEYYFSILHLTGSDLFNIRMRNHARYNGYTLNEYSLRKLDDKGQPGDPIAVSSEEDIFSIIDFPYKIPEERDL